jgi:hypothetical protein
VTRLLLAAYFLEAGLVLIVAPWSAFWERNFFVSRLPQLAEFFSSPVARGAVSGIGLVTTIAGLAEFGAAFYRRATPDSPAGSTLHSDQ